MLLFVVYVCLLGMYVCTFAQGVWSLGTGVTDSFKLPCGCWDPNSSVLEDKTVLNHWAVSPPPVIIVLTIKAERT